MCMNSTLGLDPWLVLLGATTMQILNNNNNNKGNDVLENIEKSKLRSRAGSIHGPGTVR